MCCPLVAKRPQFCTSLFLRVAAQSQVCAFQEKKKKKKEERLQAVLAASPGARVKNGAWPAGQTRTTEEGGHVETEHCRGSGSHMFAHSAETERTEKIAHSLYWCLPLSLLRWLQNICSLTLKVIFNLLLRVKFHQIRHHWFYSLLQPVQIWGVPTDVMSGYTRSHFVALYVQGYGPNTSYLQSAQWPWGCSQTGWKSVIFLSNGLTPTPNKTCRDAGKAALTWPVPIRITRQAVTKPDSGSKSRKQKNRNWRLGLMYSNLQTCACANTPQRACV